MRSDPRPLGGMEVGVGGLCWRWRAAQGRLWGSPPIGGGLELKVGLKVVEVRGVLCPK